MLRRVTLHPLDPTAVAPFGKVIGPALLAGSTAADARGLEFGCDGKAELTLVRWPYKPIRFSVFERHHRVSQAFIILEGIAAVAVVAPPTPGSDRPVATDVAAFLLRPGTGILVNRGVWHTLERFPIDPPHATGLLVTERETAEDFAAQQPGRRLQRSDLADLRALEGVEFEVDLG